jgi:hypothetical protein
LSFRFVLDSSKVQPWEAYAALQIAACIGGAVVLDNPHVLNTLLQSIVGASPLGLDLLSMRTLAFDKVPAEREHAYIQALADVSGISHNGPVAVPTFAARDRGPRLRGYVDKFILFAPFPVDNSLALPMTVWRGVVRVLRMFGCRVMIASDGKRMDECAFTEPEYLREHEYIWAVQNAAVTVGVPNLLTWMAGDSQKATVLFYPDTIPLVRWYWQDGREGHNVRRLIFEPDKLLLPVLLSALRDTLK